MKCVLCNFHSQECTYDHAPLARNRKRKSSNPSGQEPPLKGKTCQPAGSNGIEEYDEYHGKTILRKTLGLMNKHHAHYVGLTEPFSFPRFSLPIGTSTKTVQGGKVTVRRVDAENIFTIHEDQGTEGYEEEASRREAIQEIVGPYGPELVSLYFRVVHPIFPIIHKDVYMEKYERSHHEFTAASLGAVYLLASSYWAYSNLAEVKKPDMKRVWQIALDSFDSTIFRPKLSSVQAGLLLAQYESTDGGIVSNGSRGKLTAHLIVIAHKVGLHLDASSWDIPSWEIGLRRRLAWAMYMQDKWVSLLEGRPALISDSDWAVETCHELDFPEYQEHEEEGSSEVRKGRIIFMQMIALTRILSDLLETVFSLRAHAEVRRAPDSLQRLLELVQPIQIRLKDWYISMREMLRMDNATALKLSSTGNSSCYRSLRKGSACIDTCLGQIRLAYLTLEVTIHRRIICESCTSGPGPPLLQVCRSAARTRFVSVLEFVESLKAQHLTSFWFFGSAPCLTLLISFGNLLLGSAVDPEERQFYLTKLKEFRWTLKLNGEAGAKFMKPALAAMMVNADELCKFAPDLSLGENHTMTNSGFSPPISFDGSAMTFTSMSSTGAAPTPMTSWQDVNPGFEDFMNPPMPDMQEYLSAFAWVPPGFNGDPGNQFSGV